MNILKYNKNMIVPRKTYYGDAGFDVFLMNDVKIYGRDHKNPELSKVTQNIVGKDTYGVTSIPTGFGLELEHDEYAQFLIRSSMAFLGLSTPVAVIDSTYKGETNIIIHSINPSDIYLKRGDRVASLMVTNNRNIRDQDVKIVNIRGINTSGSSGV